MASTLVSTAVGDLFRGDLSLLSVVTSTKIKGQRKTFHSQKNLRQ